MAPTGAAAGAVPPAPREAALGDGWSPPATGDTTLLTLSGVLLLELAEESDIPTPAPAGAPGPHSPTAAGEPVRLGCGDAYVVPPGVAYRAIAHGACEYVLIDPSGTTVTGRVDG
ncbi:hypothetical protein [Streptomyces spiramenti]|uniref:Cupin domain-containing protein n=1 Tax=Streptomyces spiramenti TaxID=2720606 RepID=A0ABX1AP21_9ACTN|nr:hypothetical protein [Streptomyces spiramenti]NJP68828.1 hypothetical protein [Streptomyces spiramenti]